MPPGRGVHGEEPETTCAHCLKYITADTMPRHVRTCKPAQEARARNQATMHVSFTARPPVGTEADEDEIDDFEDAL
jgi:hypothetical protein